MAEWPLTIWRWRVGQEPGIDHARSIPGPQASPWQEMGHIPASENPKCEVREVIPADLGRELYEALTYVRDNGWSEIEHYTRPDPNAALARYEQEVGSE